MDHEKRAQAQIQHQIDLLDNFSMRSWGVVRWLFSTTPTRAKLMFFMAAGGVFLMALGLVWAVVWYDVSPHVYFNGPSPEGDRVLLTLIITLLLGLIGGCFIGPLTRGAWNWLEMRNPSAANVSMVRTLTADALEEPSLKAALERALTEEGAGMLTQRQAEALLTISKTLKELRKQEQRRLDGLQLLEGLGLVTAARNQLRSNNLNKVLPAPAKTESKPRF